MVKITKWEMLNIMKTRIRKYSYISTHVFEIVAWSRDMATVVEDGSPLLLPKKKIFHQLKRFI